MIETICATDKNSLFLWLAQHGHYISLRNLLETKPININTQSENGNTALILACDQNEVHCIRLLLEYKFDINIINNKGLSALDVSHNNKFIQCTKLLLEHNANANNLKIIL